MTQTLELIGDQKLVVERTIGENILRILAPDGRITVSISVTPSGPVLRFEGAGLTIQSSGALAIDAQSVVIRGRDGLALLSGGDATICAQGDLGIEARIQNVTAVLGSVNIQANDDVKLTGERIRMNC